MKTAVFYTAILAIAFPSAAAGQDGAEAPTALEKCRAIGSNSDRLKCYDAELDRLYGVDEELLAQREEYRRDRFGLPVDDNGMRLSELEAVVTEVDEDLRSGAIAIALDNGQVWQLTSTGGLRARFKRGQDVIISESGTGGYRIRMPDKPGFKGVERIR